MKKTLRKYLKRSKGNILFCNNYMYKKTSQPYTGKNDMMMIHYTVIHNRNSNTYISVYE
jgi:hypothetical protein